MWPNKVLALQNSSSACDDSKLVNTTIANMILRVTECSLQAVLRVILDCKVVLAPSLVEWKFATTISGAQFVMMDLAVLMLMLLADSWDFLTLVLTSNVKHQLKN